MAETGLSKSIWGFDPRSIAGCKLWIDAGDTSSITRSGNNVVTIRNKAVYFNASASNTVTTGISTFNGRNLIDIASTNFLETASNITFSTQYRSVFLVAQMGASNAGAFVFTTGGGPQFYYDGASLNFARPGAFIMQSLAGNLPSNFFNSTFVFNANNNVPTNDRGMYLNGTFVTLNNDLCSNVFSTGALQTRIGESGGAWKLGELLMYDELLTKDQRQQVEGYLAIRWGLSARLPNGHPYKAVAPFSRSFAPLDVLGCVLWLDAADRSTITLSGSNVSQWLDKSGTGNHALQGNTSNQPVFVENGRNGLPVMRFSAPAQGNPPNTRIFSNSTMAFPNAPYTVFAVGQATSNAALSTSGYNYLLKPSLTTDYFLFVGSRSNSFTTFAGPTNTWNDVADLTGGSQPTSNWTVFSIVNRGVSNGLIPYIDADVRTAKNGTTAACTGYTIGDAGVNFRGQNWNGDIAEIMVFNRDIGGDRTKIEWYLSQKWGTLNKVPATFPYAASRLAPQSTPFQSTAVSDLILWVDGTDVCGNKTVPANGTSITVWIDKSGRNNHMTASTGTPTYELSTTAVKCGGAAALLTSNVTAAPMTVFFVYKNYNGSGPIFSTNNVLSVDGFWPNNSWDTTLNRLTIARQDGNNFSFWYAQNNTPYPLNRTCMVTVQYSGTASGSTITGYLDASQVFTSTTTGTITRPFFRLAHRGSAGDFLTADYNEIMYYSRILSVQERQAVEGYLAWKWNLVSYLPSNHPYKKASP